MDQQFYSPKFTFLIKWFKVANQADERTICLVINIKRYARMNKRSLSVIIFSSIYSRRRPCFYCLRNIYDWRKWNFRKTVLHTRSLHFISTSFSVCWHEKLTDAEAQKVFTEEEIQNSKPQSCGRTADKLAFLKLEQNKFIKSLRIFIKKLMKFRDQRRRSGSNCHRHSPLHHQPDLNTVPGTLRSGAKANQRGKKKIHEIQGKGGKRAY